MKEFEGQESAPDIPEYVEGSGGQLIGPFNNTASFDDYLKDLSKFGKGEWVKKEGKLFIRYIPDKSKK